MFPIWLKISYLLFLLILIPVYYKKYGTANFLWFSDIGLFGTGIALWLENSLMVSMMAVGILLPELLWNVVFFIRLITGSRIASLTDYMFDRGKSLLLRGLSLFHVVLPPLMIYMLLVLGYERMALLFQTGLTAIILIATFIWSDPDDNINFAFGPGERPQRRIPPFMYLCILFVMVALCILLPSHIALSLLFSKELV